MSKKLVGVHRLLLLVVIAGTILIVSQCDLLLLPTDAEDAEWFVFFNKSAGEFGGDRLDLKLAEQILSAEQTVDLCFYEIDSDTLIGAILVAHNSGTQIRLITDDAYLPEVQELLDASVPVLSDSAGSVYIYKDMHNKFAVFDGEWIWTGSYNATESGTFGNANNALLFRSEETAVAYTAEFQEMWGSTSATPNPEASRFHTGKEDNHLHTFELDGHTLELYMSPSDGTKEAIMAAIATADYSISFCIFSFTDDDISAAMEAQLEDVPDLVIQGVFDETQAGSQYSEIHTMLEWGEQVDVRIDMVIDSTGAEKFLHHKYLLIDAGYDDSEPLVVTGSCNWSTNGFSYNDENTIISYNPEIVDLYLSEFEERFTTGTVPD
jgi:phosphatidylserine/phosphatidylglycerophosphate/cardiolipin synthase-like enzyme